MVFRQGIQWICTVFCFLPILAMAQPVVDLGEDTVICQGSSLLLDAQNTGATYLWSTGETTQTISVSQTGLYWVDVTDAGSTSRDSIDVTVLNPSVDVSFVDTNLCIGTYLNVSPTTNATSLYWTNIDGLLVDTGRTLNYLVGNTPDTILVQGGSGELNTFAGFKDQTFLPANSSGLLYPSISVGFSFGIRFRALENCGFKQFSMYLRPNTVLAIRLYRTVTLPGGQQVLEEQMDTIHSYNLVPSSGGLLAIPVGFTLLGGNDYVLECTNIGASSVGIGDVALNSGTYAADYLSVSNAQVQIIEGVPTARESFFYDFHLQAQSCHSTLDTFQYDVLVSPEINFPSDTLVCSDSIRISPNYQGANTTYAWEQNGVVVSTDSVYTLLQSDTVRLSVSENQQCVLTKDIKITIVGDVEPNFSNSDTSACIGQPLVLNANSSNASHFFWLDKEGLFIDSVNPISYLVTSAVDTLSVLAAGGVQKSAVGFKDQNALPANSSGLLYPNLPGGFTAGLKFDVHEMLVMKQFSMYLKTNASFAVKVKRMVLNKSGQLVTEEQLDTVFAIGTISSQGSLVAFDVNFTLFPGYEYSLECENLGGSLAIGDVALASGTYTADLANVSSALLTIKEGTPSAREIFFYDLNLESFSCVSDTAQIRILPLASPAINFPSDTLVCSDSIRISPNYQGANTSYVWENVQGTVLSTDSTFLINQTDSVRLTLNEGGLCSVSQLITTRIVGDVTPVFSYSDTSACVGDTIDIRAAGGGSNYFWLDSKGLLLDIENPLSYVVKDDKDTLTVLAAGGGTASSVSFRDQNDLPSNSSGLLYPTLANGFKFGLKLDVHDLLSFSRFSMYLRPNTVLAITLKRTVLVGGVPIEEVQRDTISTSSTIPSVGSLIDINVDFTLFPGYEYTLECENIGTAVQIGDVSLANATYVNDLLNVSSPQVTITQCIPSAREIFFYDLRLESFSCISDSVNVRVNPLITPKINFPSDSIACADSLLIQANYQGVNPSFTWYDANQGQISVDTSYVLYQNDTITLTIVEGGGCSVSKQIKATIVGDVSSSLGAVNTDWCVGDTVVLTNQSNAASFLWLNKNGIVQGNQAGLTYVMGNENDTLELYSGGGKVLSYASYKDKNTIPTNSSGLLYPTIGTNASFGVSFDVHEQSQLKEFSLYLYPGAKFEIRLQRNVIASGGQTVTEYQIDTIDVGTAIPATGSLIAIPVDFNLLAGSQYVLACKNISSPIKVGDVQLNSATYVNDFNSTVNNQITILGGVPNIRELFFYNLNIEVLECLEGPVLVPLNLLPSPVINLPQDTVECTDSIALFIETSTSSTTFQWLSSQGNLLSTQDTFIVFGLDTVLLKTQEGQCSYEKEIIANAIKEVTSASIDQGALTVCRNDTLKLRAQGLGLTYLWYNQSNQQPIGFGDEIDYVVQNTEKLYLSAVSYLESKFYSLTDPSNYSVRKQRLTSFFRGLQFDAKEAMRLKSVDLHTDSYGATGVIELLDNQNTVLDTIHFGPTLNAVEQIELNFLILPGNDYTLNLTQLQGADLIYINNYADWNNLDYPVINIKKGVGLGSSRDYNVFFNWNVETILCERLAMDSIQITLDASPIITLPSDTSVCADSIYLDFSNTNASYTWTGINATGAQHTLFNSDTFSIEIVKGNCSLKHDMTVLLNAPPSSPIISADTTFCKGEIGLAVTGVATDYAWYLDSLSPNSIARGDSIALFAEDTMDLWVEAISYLRDVKAYGEIYNSVSLVTYQSLPGISNQYQMDFVAHEDIRLDYVHIYADSNALVEISLNDEFGVSVKTFTANLTKGRNQIEIDTILARSISGQSYSLTLKLISGSVKFLQINQYNFMVTNDPISLVGGSNGNYAVFYEWNISRVSCTSERVKTKVNIIPEPAITLLADTVSCGVGVLNLKACEQDPGTYSYVWNTGSLSNTTSVSSSGRYAVSVTNVQACTSTRDIIVQMLSKPDLSNIQDTLLCQPDTVSLIEDIEGTMIVWKNLYNSLDTSYLGGARPMYINDTTSFLLTRAAKRITRVGKQSYQGSNYTDLQIIASEFKVQSHMLLDSVAMYFNQPCSVEWKIQEKITGQYIGEGIVAVDKSYSKCFIPIGQNIPKGNYNLFINRVINNSSSTIKVAIDTTTYQGNQYSTDSSIILLNNALVLNSNMFFDWHFSLPYQGCGVAADTTMNVYVEFPLELEDTLKTCDTLLLDVLQNSIASYQWNGPSFSSNSSSVALSNSGWYTLEIESTQSSCIATDSFYLLKPTKLVIEDYAGSMCTDTLISNYQGASYSYQWSTGDTTDFIKINSVGGYALTVEADGCLLSDSVSIQVIDIPASISIVKSSLACTEDVLKVSVLSGLSTYSYSWSTGEQGDSISVNSSGMYAVTATSVNGCTSSSSTNVQLYYPPQAAFSIDSLTTRGVYFFIDNSTNRNTPNYQATIDCGDSPVIHQLNNGGYAHTGYDTSLVACYQLVFTASNSCGADTVEQLIAIGKDTSECGNSVVKPIANVNSFKVYPNPNMGDFTVSFKQDIHLESIKILSLSGRVLQEEFYGDQLLRAFSVKTQHLLPGFYLLRVRTSKGIYTQKVLIVD